MSWHCILHAAAEPSDLLGSKKLCRLSYYSWGRERDIAADSNNSSLQRLRGHKVSLPADGDLRILVKAPDQ